MGKVSRLVDVIAYCLLDNHFHLFVRQKIERGVEQFLRKLLGGYTRYFNLTRNRKGVLFQARSKIVHVSQATHFDHVPRYIILNSLDKIDKKWREHGVRDIAKMKKELLAYPHSSLDGTIRKGYDPILSDDLIDEIIDRKDFLGDLLSWGVGDYQAAEPLFLEI
ncbi:MAG: transposase [Candidatus Ryanbacteria bacterium]|nr:transposase [Candidatus Ryanbacteria bacterium]